MVVVVFGGNGSLSFGNGGIEERREKEGRKEE